MSGIGQAVAYKAGVESVSATLAAAAAVTNIAHLVSGVKDYRYISKNGQLTPSSSSSNQPVRNERQLAKAQKRYDRTVSKPKNLMDAYNRAGERANNELIPRINKKYSKYDFSDPRNKKVYDRYMAEYQNEFDRLWAEELEKKHGKRPG